MADTFDRWEAERPELERKLVRWANGERASISLEERKMVLAMVRATRWLQASESVMVGQAERLNEAARIIEDARRNGVRDLRSALRKAAETLGLVPAGGAPFPGVDYGAIARRTLSTYSPRKRRLCPDAAVQALQRQRPGLSWKEARREIWSAQIRKLAREHRREPVTILEGLEDYRAALKRELQQMPEGSYARRIAAEILNGLEGLPTLKAF